MLHVTPIKAFNDNYIWLIRDPAKPECVVVDPGDAQPVLSYLSTHQLTLTAILITHHHWDHTGGISDLLEHHTVPVYGPDNNSISQLTHILSDRDELALAKPKAEFTVFTTPGHTLDHIAYYGQGALFCGDTLFTGGCGRLFEGTATQMYNSLSKLATLADDTLIYCAHEYTQANLNFAKQVEPNRVELNERIIAVEQQRKKGLPTVPATLGLEKQTNPFLRCDCVKVRQAAEQYSGQLLEHPHEVFAVLRAWKDTATF